MIKLRIQQAIPSKCSWKLLETKKGRGIFIGVKKAAILFSSNNLKTMYFSLTFTCVNQKIQKVNSVQVAAMFWLQEEGFEAE